MLVIRFQKIGKKNQKIFRLVLQDKRWKLNGKVIQVLGWWNPYLKKGEFKKDLIEFYLKNGAKLSETAKSILKKASVLEK
ncbi:MAG: 30S ribosomal protein S16 [Candidatus Pacebacteria bacterium]|jgi:small subunit ribosomal protein S16|nr:30S ribosomal protein S16 [Candidatus Paceibacterota bacterium]